MPKHASWTNQVEMQDLILDAWAFELERVLKHRAPTPFPQLDEAIEAAQKPAICEAPQPSPRRRPARRRPARLGWAVEWRRCWFYQPAIKLKDGQLRMSASGPDVAVKAVAF